MELQKFFLLLLIHAWDIDQKKALEPSAHLFFVTKGIEADNQVETDVEVGSVVHDILVHLDSLTKALLLDQSQANILLDLQFHFLVLLGGRINCHVVILDRHVPLLLLKINVTHVDAQARRLRILLVLQDDRVSVDSFSVKAIGVVHVCQVVEDIEGQVDVDLVEAAGLFAE